MKNIKYIFLLLATVFMMNSCEEGTPETAALNYVTFEATDIDLGVTIDGSNSYEITVYTTMVTGADRTFNLMVNTDATTADGGAYEVPASVTIPANSNEGRFTVTLNDVNIGDGVEVVVELDAEEGVFTGDATTLYVTQICLKNDVVIDIKFDAYPEETSWELFDADDNLIGSGSGYTGGDAGVAAKYCLENGTYTFNIYDAWGDGGATVLITNHGAEVVSIASDYGTGKSVDFTVNN